MSEPQFEVLVGADPVTGQLPAPTEARMDTVVAGHVDNPDSDTRASLNATYARATLVRNILDFLEGDETLDATGTSSIHVVMQRAVDALALEYEGQTGAFGKFGYLLTMPGGRFKLTTGIEWASGVGLCGQGQGATILAPVGNVVAIHRWDVAGTWDEETYVDNAQFRDFTIDCADQASGGGYDYLLKGMFIQHARAVSFERVTIVDSHATAFGMDFLEDASFKSCTALRSGRGVPATRYGTGAGFGIGLGAAQLEHVTFTDCVAIGSYSSGFYFEKLSGRAESIYQSEGFSLVNCVADGNYNGLLDTGSGGLVVTGSAFTRNTYAGIVITNSGQSLTTGKNQVITSCQLTDNGHGGGIFVGDTIGKTVSLAGSLTVRDCTFTRNLGPGVMIQTASAITGVLSITGCRVVSNGAAGFDIRATSSSLKDLVVENCEIRDNGTNSGKTYRSGISILAALDYPRIVNNTLRRTSGASAQPTGIALLGSVTTVKPRISGNTALGHSVAQITVDHTVADATRITDNITS